MKVRGIVAEWGARKQDAYFRSEGEVGARFEWTYRHVTTILDLVP